MPQSSPDSKGRVKKREFFHASFLLMVIIIVILHHFYNFINDRLVDESAVLRVFVIAFDFICVSIFFTKVEKISDHECPGLNSKRNSCTLLYGTQKKCLVLIGRIFMAQ